jgi:hypothetical protein
MMDPTQYVIRPATPLDAEAIRSLALLDGRREPEAPVLIGELDGRPAAALSLVDGHAVSDPFQRTVQLVAYLRVRANAVKAVEAEPDLRRRMLAAVPPRLRPNPA